MASPQPPIVLVFDPAEESRTVLIESLRHWGAVCLSAQQTVTAYQRLADQRPAAMVLALDGLTEHELRLLARRASDQGVPVIAVGTNRPTADHPALVFVRKPYHYRELISKITRVFGQQDLGENRAA